MSPETGEHLRSLYTSQGGVSQVFSTKVADYAAARPDYPPQLFDALSDDLGVGRGSRVVDVGSGTGLFTRGLLGQGYCVTAVEPNASMRAASDAFFGDVPGYRSAHGSAESIPENAGSIDLITAAQAFHWFEIDKARAEFLRVLHPHGQVALIWNDRVADDPLQVALEAILKEFGGDKRSALVSHQGRGDLQRFFGATVPRELIWPHKQHLTESDLLSLVFSRSYMPHQESDMGQRAANEVRKVFRQFARKGSAVVHYIAILFAGRPTCP